MKRRSFLAGLLASLFTKPPTSFTGARYLSHLATIQLDARSKVTFFPSIRQTVPTQWRFHDGNIDWHVRSVSELPTGGFLVEGTSSALVYET